MQNWICNILLIVFLTLNFIACNSENSTRSKTSHLDGKYTGTFTVEYKNGGTFSNLVSINFYDNTTYQSSGNKNYIPAGGSGTYTQKSSKVTFLDTNYWTANFDGNLILNGEYNYSLNGNELMLSANKNNLGLYKYKLTKGK